MTKFILGEKIGMGEVYDKKGALTPVTLILSGPCKITQIKTKEKDGYDAAQVGFGKIKRINKPKEGHLKSAGKFHYLREFKISSEEKGFKVGDEIKVDVFKENDKVTVSGISKGKGFQGVVKRHHFKGSPKTHGHKHDLRAPGSIGCGFPERVVKGRKMAGRMGADRITIKKLEVMKVDKDKNIIALKGALPGRAGTLISICLN